MKLVRVDDLELVELEPYRTLREHTQHWRGGYFVAEGEKVVRRLLASDIGTVSVLCSAVWLDVLASELGAERHADLTVYVAPDDVLEQVVGYALHKRIMAIGRIPAQPDLDALGVRSGVHVAVEGIADAENMGVMLRACAGMGAASFIAGADSTSPWLRRSVRVSMGTVFGLPVYRCDDVRATLGALQARHGWRIVGTVPRGGVPTLPAGDAPICLWFGSEGTGLSDEAIAMCDGLFTIPMHGDVDSLNVANAMAVALYAALHT
jgi:tRNA G18 (ribose-2'-O)-methylase SpoU